MSYSTSLSQKLDNFTSTIPISEQQKRLLIAEIIRHVLRIPSVMATSNQDIEKDGPNNLRSLAFELGCIEEFTFFKSIFLDVSYYLHRVFWIETVKYFRDNVPPSAPVAMDIVYMQGFLKDADFINIKEIKTNEHFNLDHIDLNTWETGQNQKRKLEAYVKSKIKNLTFLTKYDPGLSLEDFAQDLAAEVVRIHNVYQRSLAKNLPKGKFDVDLAIQMYVESSLNYKVSGIKGYFTCESRRRVGATEEMELLQKEKKKLVKERAQMAASKSPQGIAWAVNEFNIKNCTSTDYHSIAVPMKYYSGDEDTGHEREFCGDDLATDAESNFSAYSQQNPRDVLDDDLWVNGIIEKLQKAAHEKKVNDRIVSFVKIVTSKQSDDLDGFHVWVKENNVNTNNFGALVNGAKKYCNLKKSDLKNQYLRSVILTHRGTNAPGTTLQEGQIT